MLIALGMGLRWSAWHPGNFWPLFGVLLFRLLVVPALALSLARGMGFTGDTLTALVLEAAMPCMLLGIVYCDRYHLDTAFYALAVTLTTLFGMLSLPFWYRYASAL
jgi:predicted permease